MRKLEGSNDSIYFSLLSALIIGAFGIIILIATIKKDRPADKILIGNGTNHVILYDNDRTENDKWKSRRCVPCWYDEEHLCCDKKDIRKWRRQKKSVL